MQSNGKRVLVVEDDADSRKLFDEILLDAEFEPVCVDHDALPEADGFSTIVSDLPEARGGYSSERMSMWARGLQTRYRAPLIVVTGRMEAARDSELRRASAHVVTKPIDVDAFVERVRNADRRRTPR